MLESFLLTNKVILITGATSGIGFGTAQAVIEMGAKIIISGRNEEKLSATKSNLGSSVIQTIVCDFYIEEDIAQLAKEIFEIDGVVHCAGIVKPYPIRYLNFKKLDETLKINFYSAVSLVSQLDQKRKLKNYASLVFISSISAEHPHKGGSSYSASKAALGAFVKVAAMEYSHKKIRVNTVSPAMVNTPLYKNASEEISDDSMQTHIDKYPLGIGEVDDVAHAIIYLLSDASKWVTGTNIVLDGGVLLGY